jgi:L-alanine-DL-glutamate epimerase-like enolase superfamily enzyme
MRIDSVRVGVGSLPMARPMRTAVHCATHTHNAVVEVEVDGLVGQGVALTLHRGQADAVATLIADLAGTLIGRDASAIRQHWQDMRRRLSLVGATGIGALALSAIDTALWDLLGKSAGMPLFRLLGAERRSLPVYAQGGWLSMSPEEIVAEANAFFDNGFRFYKMRAGSPDWRQDVERVTRVRDALGERIQLLVDVNQGWAAPHAARAARALDDLGLYWLEEPVAASDLRGTAAIADAVATPLAAGESLPGARAFAELVALGAADVAMPDLGHCGGITGLVEVAAALETAGTPVSAHLFTEVSAHILCGCSTGLILEYMPGWWDGLFEESLEFEGGTLAPPDRPGIGFTLRESPSHEIPRA